MIWKRHKIKHATQFCNVFKQCQCINLFLYSFRANKQHHAKEWEAQIISNIYFSYQRTLIKWLLYHHNWVIYTIKLY